MNPSAAQVDAVLRSVAAGSVAHDRGPDGLRCGCGAAPLVVCCCCGERAACAVCLAQRRDGGWSCSTCGSAGGYICEPCLRAMQLNDPLVVVRHYEDHAAQRLLEEHQPMPRLHWEAHDNSETFKAALHGRALAVTTYRWGRAGRCWIGLLGSTVLAGKGGAYLEFPSAREAQLAVEAAARLACESKGQRFPGPFHKLGCIARDFWAGLRGKADTEVA